MFHFAALLLFCTAPDSIEVTVLRPDGRPAAGVGVSVADGQRRLTDDSGVATLPSAGWATPLTLRAEGGGSAVTVDPVAGGDRVHLRLPVRSAVSGRILSPGGEPVVGVEVSLRSEVRTGTHPIAIETTATTDEKGRWSSSLPNRSRRATISCRSSRTAPYRRTLYVPQIASARRGDLVSRVDPGFPIRVRVVDTSGKPVQGAGVWIPDGIGGPVRGRTGGEGLATLTGTDGRPAVLPPHPVRVRAAVEGYSIAEKFVSPGAGGPVSLRLGETRPCRLVVSDFKGDPVAGATISFGPDAAWAVPAWGGRTDSQGRWTFRDSPVNAPEPQPDDGPGSITAAVECEGYEPRAASFSAWHVGTTTRGIELLPENGVDVEAVDGLKGVEIRPDAVRLQKLVRGRWQVFPRIRERRFPPRESVVARGGTYRVVVAAKGYADTASEPFNGEETPRLVDVRLRPAAAVTAVVRAPGKPVGNALVWETSAWPTLPDGREAAESLAEWRSASDGSITFAASDVPRTIVVWSEAGYLVGAKDVADLRLTPWRSEEGRVVINETPSPGASVVRRTPSPDARFNFRSVSRSDGLGRFRVPRLPQTELISSTLFTGDGGESFTYASGADPSGAVGVGQCGVAGTVRVPKDYKVADVLLAATTSDGETVGTFRPGWDGRFKIGGLPRRGSLRVTARPVLDPESPRSDRPPKRTAELALELHSGRVVDLGEIAP